MTASIEITIDSTDPLSSAAFWEAALGYERRYEREPYIALGPPAGDARPVVLIQRVDDVELGKTRAHLDLRVDDPSAEVARLQDLGAEVVNQVDETEVGGSRWTVLTDPQGVHFCVCPARA